MGNDVKGEVYSDDETARRRDKVIRRMANTPPQPKTARDQKKENQLTRVAWHVRSTWAVSVRPKRRSVGL